jgi:ribosomal protein S27AE
MKIIITEYQYSQLIEKSKEKKVFCEKCGWSWKLSEGGDDKYICHKCGCDNSPKENKD